MGIPVTAKLSAEDRARIDELLTLLKDLKAGRLVVETKVVHRAVGRYDDIKK